MFAFLEEVWLALHCITIDLGLHFTASPMTLFNYVKLRLMSATAGSNQALSLVMPKLVTSPSITFVALFLAHPLGMHAMSLQKVSFNFNTP